MLENFNSFASELHLINMILEGKITYSEEFLNRIKKISDDSIVAIYLDRLHNKNIESPLPQNFIDVSNTDDTVTFLSDLRAKDMPGSEFSDSRRSTMRVGRLATAILGNADIVRSFSIPRIQPSDYEKFVNLYKSEFSDNSNTFKLVTGEDIRKYYLIDNQALKTGELGMSCMAGEESQENFGIYEENPDVCRLLVYLDGNGDVLGRALIWKLKKKVRGISSEYLMDRVYCAKNSDIIKFHKYCSEMGWVRKVFNTGDEWDNIFFTDGNIVSVSSISVALGHSKFKKYPYVDTLSYLNPKSGCLYNVEGPGCWALLDTDGEYDDDEIYMKRSDKYIQLLRYTSTYAKYSKYVDILNKEIDRLSDK